MPCFWYILLLEGLSFQLWSSGKVFRFCLWRHVYGRGVYSAEEYDSEFLFVSTSGLVVKFLVSASGAMFMVEVCILKRNMFLFFLFPPLA